MKTEQVVEPKVETEDIKKSGFMGLFKKKEKDADEFIENYRFKSENSVIIFSVAFLNGAVR